VVNFVLVEGAGPTLIKRAGETVNDFRDRIGDGSQRESGFATAVDLAVGSKGELEAAEVFGGKSGIVAFDVKNLAGSQRAKTVSQIGNGQIEKFK
jgi:hypothetical protein